MLHTRSVVCLGSSAQHLLWKPFQMSLWKIRNLSGGGKAVVLIPMDSWTGDPGNVVNSKVFTDLKIWVCFGTLGNSWCSKLNLLDFQQLSGSGTRWILQYSLSMWFWALNPSNFSFLSFSLHRTYSLGSLAPFHFWILVCVWSVAVHAAASKGCLLGWCGGAQAVRGTAVRESFFQQRMRRFPDQDRLRHLRERRC